MADRLISTNDAWKSYDYDEEVFTFGLANATSANTGSAQHVISFVAKRHGRISDFYIRAVPAVSASGFVSANLTANVRINSVSALSTLPVIDGPVGSAGAATAKATNVGGTSAAGNPGPVSAVINSASANFSAGDLVSIEYNLQSGGSAAAGTAGTGFAGTIVVRYSPN